MKTKKNKRKRKLQSNSFTLFHVLELRPQTFHLAFEARCLWRAQFLPFLRQRFYRRGLALRHILVLVGPGHLVLQL